MAVLQTLPLFILASWVAISSGQSVLMGQLPPMNMAHQVVMDQEGKFLLRWTPMEKTIVFEVQVATLGYVGLGFSPSGGMRNADIIVGWVDDNDGQVYLHDRFATGYGMPVIDDVEDVELLGGFQNDSHTILRFSRPWDTCDDMQDMKLSEDTMRVIWAYTLSDPSDENSLDYHNQRGTKSIYLNEPQFVLPEFEDGVRSWDLLASNAALPNAVDTLYWCKLYKVPPLPRKVQAIAYEAIVQPGNEQHVHHIVLYECMLDESAKHYEKWLNIQGAQCHSENMPPSWQRCQTPLIAWAIGSEGEVFPEHVGFPLGEEHGGATYFMMETHYDNPNLRQDIFDNSGIRIYYTEKLREFEAGYLMIGSDVSSQQIVPPGQEKWLTIGHCTGDCTQKMIPSEGINIFQGLLHSHVLGRTLSLRQIRGGRELPRRLEDMAYDFNYQQTRVLRDEMKILPGDSFIMECGYDSSQRNVPTFGGLGTSEEMCLAFLAYYPRTNLSLCSSTPLLQNVYESVGIEDIYDREDILGFDLIAASRKGLNESMETELANSLLSGEATPDIVDMKISHLLKTVVANSPPDLLNTSLYDVLNDPETWKNPSTLSRLQDISANGRHSVTCLLNDFTKVTEGVASETNYPSFIPLDPAASTCNSIIGDVSSDQITPDDSATKGGNVVTGNGSPLQNMELMHRVSLDQLGNYVMLWTPYEDEITFEVQVATRGYVGLGFSPNGGMKGADIILGWVDDGTGETFLNDRYASGYMVPKIDETEEVTLLGGYQNDTHTVLRFSRPWNSCDEKEDMALGDDTVRIIWAYGTADPEGNAAMGLNIHSERGTKSLYLKEPQLVLPEFGDDVSAWDIRSPNVSLPDDLSTIYWCKIFKIPEIRRKTHVIGYIPLISDDNIQHVHHILLYECHLPDSGRHFEKWLDIDGAQCFGPNMPQSWQYCSSPLVAWAIGGEGDMFPEHVGFPLGEEHGGATYFMMELHYDNPNLRQGVVDNSGVRLFHTENLRPYDAGILMIGADVSPLLMVPPGKEWLTIGHCSGECTKNTFPDGGINVFASILHSHLLGSNITVRHIRDNKEQPIIARDMNYDFNFQETRDLKQEVTILPGDSFITECGYDSTNRPVPTFGGFGTKEEMCLGFLTYYPRVDVSLCSSSPTIKNLFFALGIEDIYTGKEGEKPQGIEVRNSIDEDAEMKLAEALKNGKNENGLIDVNLVQLLRGIVIKAPLKYQNQSLYDIVTSEETWKDESLLEKLQEIGLNGNHTSTCDKKSDARNVEQREKIEIAYPTFEPLPPTFSSCSPGSRPGSMKPLVCPPQVPSCNQFRWPNNVLGNRPSFF